MIVYRLLLTLFAPVLAVVMLLRLLRGLESRADLVQRLGRCDGPAGAIWLHGASNGELTSAKALIGVLRGRFAQTPIHVTCNTVTARQMVKGWAMPGVSAQLAPFDYRWILARFRKVLRPNCLIVLENELWPNRVVTGAEPAIFIAARLSDRSARR